MSFTKAWNDKGNFETEVSNLVIFLWYSIMVKRWYYLMSHFKSFFRRREFMRFVNWNFTTVLLRSLFKYEALHSSLFTTNNSILSEATSFQYEYAIYLSYLTFCFYDKTLVRNWEMECNWILIKEQYMINRFTFLIWEVHSWTLFVKIIVIPFPLNNKSIQ